MLDNKGKMQPQDDARISITERYEVEYWSKKFGVTQEELRNAVHDAGTSVRAVEQLLKDRGTGHEE